MTISYTVGTGFGGFLHLLWRWKGSVIKLVWTDLAIFILLYFSCSGIYRFALDDDKRELFEKIVKYCDKYGTLIPVSFVLGFYVSLVIGRWWAQYKSIPWIDTMAIWINVAIKGEDDEEKMMRRTICRYVCLSITQCFTLICPRVRRRFPTTDHYIAAGLLLDNEKSQMENIIADIPKYQVHWVPMVWATTMIAQARIDNKIKADTFVKCCVDEINKIKENCNHLLAFDRIRVPLVYTQVVTLAVYTYFLSCIMGRQWIQGKDKDDGKSKAETVDLIVPIFTILQFLFYIGWLKVAESLVNPFGEDEYDFELNWMIDRHLQVSYSIVDKMQFKTPELRKDPFWEVVVPPELSTTVASQKYANDDPNVQSNTIV